MSTQQARSTYEEAAEKLFTVMSEWVEQRETTVNQANNLLKLPEYFELLVTNSDEEYQKILLNIRRLRQTFSDCANGKKIEVKDTETA